MDQTNKRHQRKTAGGKAKKVKAKDGKFRHNPAAFSFSAGPNALRNKVLSTAAKSEKREKFIRHVDKTPEEAPPYILVVHGPPKVGKSMLIRSLVKSMTGENLGSVNGPVTCVTSKSRKVTLVEAPCILSSQIDVAKVADLVLLMIDATVGFDLSTFEYLNILQTHGFPRVMGVLAKLDKLKGNKEVRKAKKTLKHRFEKELYPGALLFMLGGLDGRRYKKRDMLNLSRYISVQKFPQLTWQTQHPYVLPLSYEVEPLDTRKDKSGTRAVSFSGYVKGSRLRAEQVIHIPGAGDFTISAIKALNDPCPLPRENRPNSKDAGKLLRRLEAKHRIAYAPMCDMGAVELDGDSIYIRVPRNHKLNFTPSSAILKDRLEEDNGASTEKRAKRHPDPRNSGSEWSDDGFSDEEESTHASSGGDGDSPQEVLEEDSSMMTDSIKQIRELQKADGILDKNLGSASIRVWDENDREISAKTFREQEKLSIRNQLDNVDEMTDDEWQTFQPENLLADNDESEITAETTSRLDRVAAKLRDMPSTQMDHKLQYINQIRSRIYQYSDTRSYNNYDDLIVLDDPQMDEIDSTQNSNCEALERLRGLTEIDCHQPVFRVHELRKLFPWARLRAMRSLFFITGRWDEGSRKVDEQEDLSIEQFDNKRRQEHRENLIKIHGEAEDAQRAVECLKDEQHIGAFVRITLSGVPEEWVENIMDRRIPVILGGVMLGECQNNFMICRVKRHRYHEATLKSTDPLLFSVGWRRFQGIPYYAMEDRNDVRIRFLKYTPEHLHCLTYLWGFNVPAGSGILAVRNVSEKAKTFRICLTGLTMENHPNPKVVKKLKFIGKPAEIKKNTAFVTGMFSSSFEVSKVIGVGIQTQSGIRGVIKAAKHHNGDFRATFEAQIRPEDIIICKSWYKVPFIKFCNPLLDVPSWHGLRSLHEIKKDLQKSSPQEQSSIQKGSYLAKTQIGQTRLKKLKKMVIPAKIAARLPLDALPTEIKMSKSMESMQKLLQPNLDAGEQRIEARIQELRDQKRALQLKHQLKLAAENAAKAKKQAKIDLKIEESQKKRRKEYFKGAQKDMSAKRRRIGMI